GCGLLVAECALLLRPILDSTNAAMAWRPLAEAGLVYVAAGILFDLLSQALPIARRIPAFRCLGIILGGSAIALAAHHGLGTPVVSAGVLFAAVVPQRWAWMPAVALAVWALLPAVRSGPLPDAPPSVARAASGPSFVVIVLDTLRRDHSSTYGYARDTTPNLT